jgi:hypothetical protein
MHYRFWGLLDSCLAADEIRTRLPSSEDFRPYGGMDSQDRIRPASFIVGALCLAQLIAYSVTVGALFGTLKLPRFIAGRARLLMVFTTLKLHT